MRRRGEVVCELAPPAPPCFDSAEQWRQVLISAAQHQKHPQGPHVPLLLHRGQPARFNPAFDFCADCLPSHAAAMTAQRRCNPRHLLDLLTEEPHAARPA